MNVGFAEFRRRNKISSLCQVFVANLLPCEEEGVSRHFLHQLPTPLVLDDAGHLVETNPRRLAVLLGLVRQTEVDPDLEVSGPDDPRPPYESLYLEVPVGDPVVHPRPELMEEASNLFVQVADEGAPSSSCPSVTVGSLDSLWWFAIRWPPCLTWIESPTGSTRSPRLPAAEVPLPAAPALPHVGSAVGIRGSLRNRGHG